MASEWLGIEPVLYAPLASVTTMSEVALTQCSYLLLKIQIERVSNFVSHFQQKLCEFMAKKVLLRRGFRTGARKLGSKRIDHLPNVKPHLRLMLVKLALVPLHFLAVFKSVPSIHFVFVGQVDHV